MRSAGGEEDERVGLLTGKSSTWTPIRSPFSFFASTPTVFKPSSRDEKQHTLYSLDAASPFDRHEDELLRKHFGDTSASVTTGSSRRDNSLHLEKAELSDTSYDYGQRPSLGAAVLGGLKQNLVPGLVVLLIGTAVVASYYLYPPARSWLDELAAFKKRTGYLFSFVSTAFFGGVLPFFTMLLKDNLTSCSRSEESRNDGMRVTSTDDGVGAMKDDQLSLKSGEKVAEIIENKHDFLEDDSDDHEQNRQRVANHQKDSFGMKIAQFAFYLLFWGYKGIEVDAFYRLQGLVFGEGTDVVTIAIKVFVDQFIFNPVWAAPSITIAFMWKDCDFSFSRLGKELGWDFITFRVPSVLCSTWMVWVPAVSLIYALPGTLQIPLFNLVLCFFVLILTFIVNKG